MSRVHECDEDAELIDDPALEAEIDAAIADADAHPGEASTRMS